MNKRIDYDFIPISSILVRKYGSNVAIIFGKIWQLENISGNNSNYLSQNYLCKEFNLSRKTIGLIIKILLDSELIIDVTNRDKNIIGLSRSYKINYDIFKKLLSNNHE